MEVVRQVEEVMKKLEKEEVIEMKQVDVEKVMR